MNPWWVRGPGKGRGTLEWGRVGNQAFWRCDPALSSFGCEHGDFAQCTHLSSCVHWVVDLLCTFQAMESQIPCSAHGHWPASAPTTSQKASCIQPTSWAAGEEKGWEEKGLEP